VITHYQRILKYLNPDRVHVMVDGVVELSIARDGESLVRSLTVKRLTGRKVSASPTEFDIVPGRGILFRKPRIPLRILTPVRKTMRAQ